MKPLLLCLLLAGCSYEPAAVETLQKSGFTNITTTGWAPIGCYGDSFGTGFVAVNPQGAAVEGVVCCGWVKSCTVRF